MRERRTVFEVASPRLSPSVGMSSGDESPNVSRLHTSLAKPLFRRVVLRSTLLPGTHLQMFWKTTEGQVREGTPLCLEVPSGVPAFASWLF